MRAFAWRLRGRAIAIAGACVLLTGCGDELVSPAFFENEAPACWMQLGCITERNIAAVVDRPTDLAMPRREQPRDSVRRETVLSIYRSGGLQAPNAGHANGEAARP